MRVDAYAVRVWVGARTAWTLVSRGLQKIGAGRSSGVDVRGATPGCADTGGRRPERCHRARCKAPSTRCRRERPWVDESVQRGCREYRRSRPGPCGVRSRCRRPHDLPTRGLALPGPRAIVEPGRVPVAEWLRVTIVEAAEMPKSVAGEEVVQERPDDQSEGQAYAPKTTAGVGAWIEKLTGGAAEPQRWAPDLSAIHAAGQAGACRGGTNRIAARPRTRLFRTMGTSRGFVKLHLPRGVVPCAGATGRPHPNTCTSTI